MTRSTVLLYLLSAIVILQSVLLWKLCGLHRALLVDVACVPIFDGAPDVYERPASDERDGGPLL